MPRHDPPKADAYDLGRMACMTTPKSIRPRDVCPPFDLASNQYEWCKGFADEKADGIVIFNLMLKRTN